MRLRMSVYLSTLRNKHYFTLYLYESFSEFFQVHYDLLRFYLIQNIYFTCAVANIATSCLN